MLFVPGDSGKTKTGATCGTAPTLRKEREEWGTHCLGPARENQRPGPRFQPYLWLRINPGISPALSRCTQGRRNDNFPFMLAKVRL
jgi:hypothetical protein